LQQRAIGAMNCVFIANDDPNPQIENVVKMWGGNGAVPAPVPHYANFKKIQSSGTGIRSNKNFYKNIQMYVPVSYILIFKNSMYWYCTSRITVNG
jgi:predicted SpoU family rRNA methylase